MANEEPNKSLVMPGLCLFLLLLIFKVSFPGKPSAPVHAFSHPSVSLQEPQFIPAGCENLTSLPYRPANSLFGRWKPHGAKGFVFASAHRLSAASFVVLGLTPVATQAAWGTFKEMCLWVTYAGPRAIQGELDFHFVEEGHSVSHLYDIILVHCTLSEPTPKDAGGALFVNIQGVDDLLAYREDPGPRELNPPTPLPSTLTVCSTLLAEPEFGASLADRMVEQLQYLRFMGADGFTLYDGGALGAELASALVPFVAAGLVEFVDFRGLPRLSIAGDVVVANDCAYRHRLTSSWVLLLAPDEYPALSDSSQRLSSLMRTHAGVPWISFGVYIWDTEMCFDIHVQEKWWLERFLWRLDRPVCQDNATDPKVCPGQAGLRRLLLDPRRVAIVLQHRVVSPDLEGIVLSIDTAQVNKYLGLMSPAALICEYPVSEKHESPEWVRDGRMRTIIQEGRASKGITLPS